MYKFNPEDMNKLGDVDNDAYWAYERLAAAFESLEEAINTTGSLDGVSAISRGTIGGLLLAAKQSVSTAGQALVNGVNFQQEVTTNG